MKMSIKPPEAFSLRLTALSHGFCQVPPFEWDEARQTLYMAVKLNGTSPFTATMRQTGAGLNVNINDVSLAREDKRKLTGVISHCLKLDEDFSGFYSMCEGKPVFETAAQNGAGRIMRSPTVFEDLVKSICGTNVAWKQAVKMIHAICELGDAAPDGRRLFPHAATIAEAGPVWLREKARVGYRADYIVELCERVARGEIDLSPVDRREMDGERLRKLFLSIKGIGKSTAHYLLMLHGEYSNLSIDSATHAVMKKITGKTLTNEQIEKRYESFGKYRALAMWYEWITHSGWLDGF